MAKVRGKSGLSLVEMQTEAPQEEEKVVRYFAVSTKLPSRWRRPANDEHLVLGKLVYWEVKLAWWPNQREFKRLFRQQELHSSVNPNEYIVLLT